jgi:hypothetical protein
MTASIVYIDDFRPVPSLIKQRQCRENAVRQAVKELYPHIWGNLVWLACEAAVRVVKQGRSFVDAMEAARRVIEESKS